MSVSHTQCCCLEMIFIISKSPKGHEPQGEAMHMCMCGGRADVGMLMIHEWNLNDRHYLLKGPKFIVFLLGQRVKVLLHAFLLLHFPIPTALNVPFKSFKMEEKIYHQ